MSTMFTDNHRCPRPIHDYETLSDFIRFTTGARDIPSYTHGWILCYSKFFSHQDAPCSKSFCQHQSDCCSLDKSAPCPKEGIRSLSLSGTKTRGKRLLIYFARIHAEWNETAYPEGGEEHDNTQKPRKNSIFLLYSSDNLFSTARTFASSGIFPKHGSISNRYWRWRSWLEWCVLCLFAWWCSEKQRAKSDRREELERRYYCTVEAMKNAYLVFLVPLLRSIKVKWMKWMRMQPVFIESKICVGSNWEWSNDNRESKQSFSAHFM